MRLLVPSTLSEVINVISNPDDEMDPVPVSPSKNDSMDQILQFDNSSQLSAKSHEDREEEGKKDETSR